MLQVGCSHPGFTFQSSESTERYEPIGMTITPNGPYPGVSAHSPPTPPYSMPSGHVEKHNVVVHWTQGGHSFTNDSRSDDDANTSDTDFRPFTPPPPRERLSYTRYQLELLNGIYKHVKYPNSTQKLLVAKRVGITRDQVKIWFQNRRRKDVLAKQGKKVDEGNECPGEASPDANNADNGDENRTESMVPSLVLDSVISELIKFKNEHLKSKKQKGKKKTAAPVKTKRPEESGHMNSVGSQIPPRLFSGYDMISPPNQVTPTAYSDIQFTNNGNNKLPAFDRPSDKNRQTSPLSYLNPDLVNSNSFGVNRRHGDWNNYLPNPNNTCEFQSDNSNSERNGRSSNEFTPDNPKFGLNDHIAANQQPGTSDVASRVCSLPLPGSHLETIPVLSDLLGHSGRQYSCDVRSRGALYSYGQENILRDRNEGHFKYRGETHDMMAFPIPPFVSQVPFDVVSSNRAYPFPTPAETTSLSATRHSEPCRPQPHYPSSFTHHDSYQPFPLSALSTPFYSHQPSAQAPQWHDSSHQNANYLQL